MNKTAVVFGATGLVGKDLVKELLLDNGYEKIMLVVRRDLAWQHPKMKALVIQDFSELNAWKDQLKADVFFVCIGTTIGKAGSQDAFRKVDLDLPVLIASIAEKLSVANLVVISSIGANASSSNFYLRTKGQMEKAVKYAYNGNLKFVRPSLLMGNRDEYRLAEKLSASFMKIAGWMFTGPLKKYKGIASSEVAKAMILATELPIHIVNIESDQLASLTSKKTI